MTHFVEPYADRVNDLLHLIGGARFYRQEVVEVTGLVTGLLITYDNVADDERQVRSQLTWDEFLERMSLIKADWKRFDRTNVEALAAMPDKGIHGWEGRTIYFLKGGSRPEQWSAERATRDVTVLVRSAHSMLGPLVELEVQTLRARLPPGSSEYRRYEDFVRIVFNYLFRSELGEGQAQSRTEPENEGIEIRDVVFANQSNSGFWKDLKDKYSASEIVVDTKNTDDLTRDDLRQLYCYLKPALGYWGVIVCRSEPSTAVAAFNRTLYQNFQQSRGVLILCDDDLRRMVELARRGGDPSVYLQSKMSTFVRSV
jgi:hypothetical protein